MIWSKKKLCFICNSKMAKEYSTLNYRYEGGKIGTVELCEKCTKNLETPNIGDIDEPI